MKKEMDIFGEALFAYFHGDSHELYMEDGKGEIYPHPLGKYFRSYNQLNKIEKKIVALSKGKILDVGCGAGNYIHFLNKKGKVLGIDISSKVIEVCKERGFDNVKVADIFKLKTKDRFDTIVLLENNLGMSESPSKAKKLLRILRNLLNKNGQILTNERQVRKDDYFDGKIRMHWKNKKSSWIYWISFNSKFLNNMCREVGMKMQVLDKDKYCYLARITN